jgi:tRNA G18 (ribose-2'-O)-methylase SpoU
LLFLDCITNTGNFGAIIRSAWFLGVDAIIIPEHGTSPVSSISVKASAGALEYMPLLVVKNEKAFVKSSQANGWKFFVAAAPEESDSSRQGPVWRIRNVDPEGALSKNPCVLVLGNEERGVRPFLRSLMAGSVGIPNSRFNVGVVDSLNVSVASALLTQRFFDSTGGGHEESASERAENMFT